MRTLTRQSRGFVLWMDGISAVAIALLVATVFAQTPALNAPSVLDAQTLASDASTVLIDAYPLDLKTALLPSGSLGPGAAGFLDALSVRHPGTCFDWSFDTASGSNCPAGKVVRVSAVSVRGLFSNAPQEVPKVSTLTLTVKR